MWLLVTCMLLGGSAPIRDPLAPYRNRPVVAIDLQAPPGEDVDELRELVTIEPGYLLSAADLREAEKRLYSLGRFSQVSVRAERLSGSVVLHFYLTPLRRLESITIEGLKRANEDTLAEALHIEEGSEVDRRTREHLRERATQHLWATGFPHAVVKVEEQTRGPSAVAYTVSVAEGEPCRVAAITFALSPRVANWILSDLLRTRVGGVLDRDELNRDRDRILKAYLKRGFLRVKVGKPRVVGDDRRATVSFDISAGDRIAFFFRGNTLFSDEELAKTLPQGTLGTGDVEAAAERIAERYRRLGYFDAKVRVRGLRDAEHGIVRYVLYVNEGKPLSVSHLSFTGNTVFSSELLREQVQTVLQDELGYEGTLQHLSRSETALLAGTKPHADPPVPAPSERWVPELYRRILDDITTAYHNRGFLRATVGPVQIQRDAQQGLRVHVPINEGPQTLISSVSFRGNTAVGAAELLAGLEEAASRQSSDSIEASGPLAQPGAPFSHGGVEDARINIVRRYRDNGYLYMRLFSEVTFSKNGRFADVVYRFEEGPQVHVGKVLIRGNRYTRESLIQTRMTLGPGDVYRLEQALLDQRRIAALGVFSSVRVKLIDEEIPAERKDLVAEVVERNRRAIEVWPGISTADGPRLRLAYSHINLAGTSSALNLSLKLNRQIFFGFYGERADLLRERYAKFDWREKTEIEARASVRSPRLLNLPFNPTARFDLVGERDNAIPYSLDAGRAIFGLDLVPLERLNIAIEPQFALAGLRCFPSTVGGSDRGCEGDVLESRRQARRIDEGLRATFKVGPTITYDGRDDPLNPSRGLLASARAVWAWGSTLPPDAMRRQELGEQLNSNAWQPFFFSKVEGALTGYVPVWRFVLALSARVGAVTQGAKEVKRQGGPAAYVVPIDERFYVGGDDSLRGFYESALFPEDLCVRARNSKTSPRAGCYEVVEVETQGGVIVDPPVSAGGNYFAVLKSELRVPLGDKLWLGLFADVGNLWLALPNTETAVLRFSGGMGLRYATPAGPIGFDVGVNPVRRELRGERYFEPHFALGVF